MKLTIFGILIIKKMFFFKEVEFFNKFFRKKINFACWSDDKNVLSSLKKGLSNSQGCDSDIDSSLFQD